MIRSLMALFVFHAAYAHREHKVHNIVLYPEKHSWCKTTAIKEVVGHPGCEAIEVDNNVCVGACFSYSIPRTEPTAPGEVAPYCDSCQPSRIVWKHDIFVASRDSLFGVGVLRFLWAQTNPSCPSRQFTYSAFYLLYKGLPLMVFGGVQIGLATFNSFFINFVLLYYGCCTALFFYTAYNYEHKWSQNLRE